MIVELRSLCGTTLWCFYIYGYLKWTVQCEWFLCLINMMMSLPWKLYSMPCIVLQLKFIKFMSLCGRAFILPRCDGLSDRTFMVDPFSYFSFQSVLHNWYYKAMVCTVLFVNVKVACEVVAAGFLSWALNGPLSYLQCLINVMLIPWLNYYLWNKCIILHYTSSLKHLIQSNNLFIF